MRKSTTKISSYCTLLLPKRLYIDNKRLKPKNFRGSYCKGCVREKKLSRFLVCVPILDSNQKKYPVKLPKLLFHLLPFCRPFFLALNQNDNVRNNSFLNEKVLITLPKTIIIIKL